MKNVIVRKSKIHGKGVFANQNFKKGEKILDIDDTHVVKDASKLTEYQRDFQCDWLDNKAILMQEPERYINHSCDPNSYIKTKNNTRSLLAMRNIKKGKEITYDYAINGYYESKIICKCGTRYCRKVLNCDFFQLPKNIQLEYIKYLDNWFINKYKDKIQKLKQKDY